MTDLLSKNKRYEWEEQQDNAFKTIKQLLINRSILVMYNPKAHTEVHTDACLNGVTGVLMQKGEDDKMHPVSYYSQKTSREFNK